MEPIRFVSRDHCTETLKNWRFIFASAGCFRSRVGFKVSILFSHVVDLHRWELLQQWIGWIGLSFQVSFIYHWARGKTTVAQPK